MLLSGEMTQERQKELSGREKFDRWMVNEGYRRVYVYSGRFKEEDVEGDVVLDQG